MMGCADIALIATDLDGTLLNPERGLTNRARLALDATRQAGITVVAVTGRTYRSAVRLLPNAPIDYIVSSNGAVIWNAGARKVGLARIIDPIAAGRSIEWLRSSLAGAAIGWETLDGCGFDAGFRACGYDLDELEFAPVPEPAFAAGVAKLFFGHPDIHTGDDAMVHLRPHVPPELNASTSGAPFLEITGPGVDKATTLALLCDQLRIDASEVIAFGDHVNDVPMLQWAGISVAMANSHTSVGEECDEIAASNAEDGVARRIEVLLRRGT